MLELCWTIEAIHNIASIESCTPSSGDFFVGPRVFLSGVVFEHNVEVVGHDGICIDFDGEEPGEVFDSIEENVFSMVVVCAGVRVSAE